MRNRIEAYLTGLAGAADTAGDSRVLGAGTTGSLVAIATGSPVAVGSGMVNTANALHDLPTVKDAWAAGSISGLHVYQILAHAPAIDDFTSKQAAIVGLAKLTDASEVRRVLQVAAEADNPTHLDLSLDQQRAKRSLRLSARANGMWAITGMLDEVDGAILAETLASFTRPPDTHDTTTPAQRRADALTDMSKAAAANTHPGGVSAVSILVDLENLPTSDNATLVDGTPLGAGIVRPVVVRGGVHGDLRDQTHRHLHPPRPRTKTTPGIRGPMGRADRPRPRLHPLRTDPAALPRPPHHPLERRRQNRPLKPRPPLFKMS
ncbi:MAG: DUF222 domain-containing protein [Candidatus Nanopelagicales bacterium]